MFPPMIFLVEGKLRLRGAKRFAQGHLSWTETQADPTLPPCSLRPRFFSLEEKNMYLWLWILPSPVSTL